jgi:hypothetical protein
MAIRRKRELLGLLAGEWRALERAERPRERGSGRESREMGRSWRVESVGETETKRAAERRGKAGEWRALAVGPVGTRQSALRWSALEWVKASSGLDSSRLQRELQDCGRKKKGRRSAAAKRGAEEEENGGRWQPKEKREILGKKKLGFHFLKFQLLCNLCF